MPLMFPECRRSGAIVIIAALAAIPGSLRFQSANAAGEACNTRAWDSAERRTTRDENGNFEILDLKLTQCSTVLMASNANSIGTRDAFPNGTWKLTGVVHLEFDGATLDAQAATVVVADNRVSSVEVQPPAAQQSRKPVHVEFRGAVLDVDTATVTLADGRIRTIQAAGTPAQFSHEHKKLGHVQGRSGKIDYDAATRDITLSVGTWFLSGSRETKTNSVTYNVDKGTWHADDSTISVRPGERVPAPRAPDRASAK